jgi:hypothetical protein
MFDYLDRYYLKNGGPQNLTETALARFRDKIFKKREVELRKSILE